MMFFKERAGTIAVLWTVLTLCPFNVAAAPNSRLDLLVVEPPLTDSVDGDHSILVFPKGHASISDQGRLVLETLLRSQKVPFRDLKISIVAFSDEPFHSDVVSPRAPENVSLAKQRIEAVKKELASLGSFSDLITYNMARPLSWYDRFMGSDREKLASCLSGEKNVEIGLSRFAQVLQQSGHPSTVVIFVSTTSSKQHP